MSKETVFNSFVIEAGKAIASLQTILANQDESDNLLLDLGYAVPDSINSIYTELKTILAGFNTSITGIINNLNDDDVDEVALVQDILTLLGTLNELIQLIRQMPAKIDTVLANFQDFLDNSGIKDTFAIRLTDYIIIKFLEEYHPTISSFLRLFGLVEVTFVEKGTYNPDFFLYEIKWDRFKNIYTNPRKNFELGYGWGSSEMNYYKLIANINAFAWSIGKLTYSQPDIELPSSTSLPVLADQNKPLLVRVPVWTGMISTGSGPEDHAAFLVDLLIYPVIDPANPTKNGIAFAPFVEGTISQTIPIGSVLELGLSADMQIGGNLGIAINSEDGVYLFADPINFKGIFKAILKRPEGQKTFLFGLGGFGIYVMDVSFATKLIVVAGEDPEFVVEVSFTVASGISAEKADSFIQKFLQNLSFNFKSTIAYSSKRGVYFIGSGALEIQIPLNLEIGFLKIKEVTVTALLPEKESIPLALDTSFSVEIGPLFATVQRIGFTADLKFIGADGQLGPVSLDVGFKPPTAIGLSLDTAAVKAGGFLSIKPGEYIGAIEIEIKSIQLAIKAIGIINTILPNNQPGFSLLIIITAEFSPIQITFGFTLNGLGGLFGYKRGFESGELRLGLKTKTLDSILFPKNVIANITKIVADLKKVFPIGNSFLIGPMVKIGWGSPSLITAEIGVIIQVPDPIVIAFLGIIRLQLPDPAKPVLKLQISFLGIIDFEKKMISLDASLSESRILTMTLTGDFALRLGWGSPAVFIFSSGGFHPDFKEAPVELQYMERLGLVIIDEKEIKLGVSTYFALTTNTVQIGAHARFWAKAGSYTALAEVGFDALIQFNPFFFQVSIYLTGRITGPMIDIVIDVRGNLSGPNVWHVWGYARAKIIFFEISIQFDKTFGEPIEEISAGVQDILPMLRDEVSKSANWKTTTVLSGGSKVSLREITPGPDKMIIHPNTVLSFNQRVVPLDVNIGKFGNKGVDPSGNRFSVTAVKVLANGIAQSTANFGNALHDSFAPGNFFEIGKDEKLSRPSFEQMKSGTEFTIGSAAGTSATPVSKVIDYEIIYIRKKKVANEGNISLLSANQVVLLASGGAAARSKLSLENTQASFQAPPKVAINRPRYIIGKKSDLQNIDANEGDYGSQAEACAVQSGLESDTLILSTQEL